MSFSRDRSSYLDITSYFRLQVAVVEALSLE